MSKSYRRILIMHPGGIGDMIMFTPALQILKSNFFESAIDVFVSNTPGAAEGLRGSSIVNEIFDFNFNKNSFFNKIKFIYKLRKKRYDLAIVTTSVNSLMGSLFAFLIGAKNRVGEYRKFKWTFYTHQIRLDGNKHKIDTNLGLLRSLNIKTEVSLPSPFFSVAEDDKKFAQEFIKKNNFKNKTLIGFFPGSSPTQQFKRWAINNFIELAKSIITDFPEAFILIFADKEEGHISLEIQKKLGNKSKEIIGYPLTKVTVLIDRCKVFITSDTGLGHIASTTHTNLISIFGPTIPERSGPVGPRVSIIQEKCRYQYHDVFTLKYDANRDHQCLKKISSGRVFSKVREILNKNDEDNTL